MWVALSYDINIIYDSKILKYLYKDIKLINDISTVIKYIIASVKTYILYGIALN